MKRVEQASRNPSGRYRKYHSYLKIQNRRLQRHRANRDPETIPAYRRYYGYED